MNAPLYSSLLTSLALAACASPATLPPETVTVNIPVAVPCITDTPKRPAKCSPANETRGEYLRCLMANHARLEGYMAELEAILSACKEELK